VLTCVPTPKPARSSAAEAGPGLDRATIEAVREGARHGDSLSLPGTGALVKATPDGTFTAVTDHLDRPTSLEFIGTPPTLSPSAGRSGRSTTPPAPPAAPRAKRPPIRRRPLGLWIKGQIGEVIALALHADQV